jgi:hypothetical protein
MLISATLARRLDMQADAVKTVAGPDIRRNSITFIPRARMRAYLSGDICETLSPMYIPRLLRAAVIVLEGWRPIRRLRHVTTLYR